MVLSTVEAAGGTLPAPRRREQRDRSSAETPVARWAAGTVTRRFHYFSKTGVDLRGSMLWTTLTLAPRTEIVVSRCALVLFSRIRNVTVEGPLPLTNDGVIQVTPIFDSQAHPRSVVIVSARSPPTAESLPLRSDRVGATRLRRRLLDRHRFHAHHKLGVPLRPLVRLHPDRSAAGTGARAGQDRDPGWDVGDAPLAVARSVHFERDVVARRANRRG